MEDLEYRIGEVSKVLRIPVETLRFYEAKGLVTPHKDPESNYRAYNFRDFDMLIDCRQMRGADFAMNEIVDVLKQDSLPELDARLEKKADHCAQKARYYHLLEEKLRTNEEKLAAIPDRVNRHEILEQAEYSYYIQRNGAVFLHDAKTEQLNLKWADYAAFMDNIVFWRQDYVTGDCTLDLTAPRSFYSSAPDETGMPRPLVGWGYGIETRWAEQLGVPLLPGVRQIRRRRAVRTVLEKWGRAPFLREDLLPALQFLAGQGLSPAPGAHGIMLARCHANQPDFVRYMEVWIPISD